MKKSIQIILGISCIGVLILFGCRKKENAEVDNETQSSVDNAIADQEFMGIVPTVNNHAINTKGAGANSGKVLAPCDVLVYESGDTVTFNPNPTFTLSMANTTCNPMPDGKTRSGYLRIRLTGKIKDAGSQMIVKMHDYKSGTVNYSCDSIIISTISSNTLFTSFNIKLINGVCQSPNWKIKYESFRTITHYPKGNPVGTDPVTEVYGDAAGTNRQGLKFTVNIPVATPIVKHKSCQFIEKGVLELTPQGFKTRTIDFGSGVCDDDATFTVNGNTVAFKLK